MIIDEMDYYTVAEAARLLRVSPPTIWRWIESGSLPALRVGKRAIRIRRKDLEQALQAVQPGSGATMERCTIHVGDARDDQVALVDELEEGRRLMLKRRQGEPLPSSAGLIRELREERGLQL